MDNAELLEVHAKVSSDNDEKVSNTNAHVTDSDSDQNTILNSCKINHGNTASLGINSEPLDNDKEKIFLKDSSDAVILIKKPLCANYRSDSESYSSDSDSSSETSTTSTSSYSSDEDNNVSDKNENYSNEINSKLDVSIFELPPLENLSISVPEELTSEIGVIASQIDNVVVVESYKDTAALDVETILFLEKGKVPLGKIFEVFGPVSEPVYAVRVNNYEGEKKKNDLIMKGLKVYYAPSTEHTTFVFLSEIVKAKGTDASWKDNVETPSEFQDFSDDDEEYNFKKKCSNRSNEACNSRKRQLKFSSSLKHEQASNHRNINATQPYKDNSKFIPKKQNEFFENLRSPSTSSVMQLNSYHPVSCNIHARHTNFRPVNRFATPSYGNNYVRFGDSGSFENINHKNSPQTYPAQFNLNHNQGLRMAFLHNSIRLNSSLSFSHPPPPPPPPPPF